MARSLVTVATIRDMKRLNRRVTMLTCYDATFAKLFARSGVDLLLVGDSLGMAVQGHSTTLPVTVEDILYHTRAVVRGRGTTGPHIVADMPFMSYQASPTDALRNAGRLLQDGGAESVKLEGGEEMAATVERLVSAGIPVMGHIGLTPQSVHKFGGHKVQGRTESDADRLVRDAKALEAAGAYAIVLETIPAGVGARITSAVSVPTIGIGAGGSCDGQVLVGYDLLGLDPDFQPRFVKRQANLGIETANAVERFVAEVRSGAYPDESHSY